MPERPVVPRQYPYDGLVKELGGLEENKSSIPSLLCHARAHATHTSDGSHDLVRTLQANVESLEEDN